MRVNSALSTLYDSVTTREINSYTGPNASMRFHHFGGDFLVSLTPAYRTFACCAILALTCLSLHYSALVSGWRYDDPAHLYFVAQYSPWEYFFIPEVMLQQSWAHITPWNALFYEIGIPLFGLDPFGHYAHLLVILFLTAVATFFLLQLWLGPWPALAAALLFLAMPATAVVGQLLMTGHYAYGLLFSILAIHTFVISLRHQRLGLSIAAAFFYALACWSKELYVPLIGVLLFLPESHWRQRLLALIPMIVVAAIYTAVRLGVIGIGGYSQPIDLHELDVLQLLRDLKFGVFGGGDVGTISALSLGTFLLMALFLRCRNYPFLFIGSLFVVALFPILSMLLGGLDRVTLLRLFYFAGWIVAISAACLMRPRPMDFALVALLLGLLISSQQKIREQVKNPEIVMEQQSHFILTASATDALLPQKFEKLNYLESLREARRLVSGDLAPIVINSPDAATKHNAKMNRVFGFDRDCQCTKPINPDSLQKSNEAYLLKLELGSGRHLSVFLEVKNLGAQKVLRWKFSGIDGAFTLNIFEFGALKLPPQGEYRYGLDVTGPIREQLNAYVHVETKDGAIVRSPLFTLSASKSNRIEWRGASVTQW